MNERKQIVEAIQRLHERRKPLNIAAVKRHSPALIDAVYRQSPFWGWRMALEEAGISYEAINIEVLDYVTCRICGQEMGALGGLHTQHCHNMYPSEYQKEFPDAEMRSEKMRCFRRGSALVLPHWEPFMTAEYALDRLHAFNRNSFPMNQRYYLLNEPSIVKAAMDHFGGWDSALTRIGLEPSKIRVKPVTGVNSADNVVRRLRERHAAGESLAASAMRERAELRSLYIYAIKAFGSYKAALTAAGVDPTDHSTKAKYDKDFGTLVAEMRKLKRLVGRPRRDQAEYLRKKYGKPPGRNFQGSWNRLADYLKIPRDRISNIAYPTSEDALCEIRERLKRQESILQSDLVDEDYPLHTAVVECIGGYTKLREILRDEGIDPEENRKTAEYEHFVSEVRSAAELSGRERWARVKELRHRHATLVHRHFKGRWRDVALRLDIPPEKLSHIRYPTKTEALYELDLRARQSKVNDQPTLTKEDAALHGFVQKSLGGYHNMRRELESYRESS